MCIPTHDSDLTSLESQSRRVVSPPVEDYDSDSDGDDEEEQTHVKQQQVHYHHHPKTTTTTPATTTVTFSAASHNQIHVIPTALSCLIECDTHTSLVRAKEDLWYQRSDILDFRRQAQEISKRVRDNQSNSSSSDTMITLSSSSSCDDNDSGSDQHDDNEDNEIRGLEVRLSLHRQDRKQVSCRRILAAQADDATPETLAQIASALSVWPQKLALLQAHQDFIGVYSHCTTNSSYTAKSSESHNSTLLLTTAAMERTRNTVLSVVQPLTMTTTMSWDYHREMVNTLRRSKTKRPSMTTNSTLDHATVVVPGRRVRCRMY